MAFVLDCSVAAAWCFPAVPIALSDKAKAMATTEIIHVPGIWPLEVSSVLSVALRRQTISSVDADNFLRLLDTLEIVHHPIVQLDGIGHVVEVALRNSLSAYDTTYLELAMRLGVPLATADKALVRAAPSVGVELVTA